ncbi:MAG: hydroxymethylpyrimidine/phosphomethylpyrimidine kinase [Sphingobacteriaceae bacterium]|nr:hydroxymethylpyrimidine/phosphomethylpyrimidine kinase [Sphingobacteriaceae bacterium]
MQTARPFVITIAGLDPSSGAGLSADLKTFEQNKVYGLSICTGITTQTEKKFITVKWRTVEEVQSDLNILLNAYPIKAVKFGIIPDIHWLKILCDMIKTHDSKIKIVVDPVIQSSTGFSFADYGNKKLLYKIMPSLTLITPNAIEFEQLFGSEKNNLDWSVLNDCTVLLKGGHRNEKKGIDTLFTKNETIEILSSEKNIYAKHGSGCVLSSAITAELAKGIDIKTACEKAKIYTEHFLNSNSTALGYHA